MNEYTPSMDMIRRAYVSVNGSRAVYSRAADDLLDELDQLRGQVARVEAWYGWRRTTDAPDEALAAPAEGGE